MRGDLAVSSSFPVNLYLSKILPVFVYPVGLTLLLALLAGLCWLFRWRRLAGVGIVLAIAVLWVAATPAVGAFLYGRIEQRYPPVAVADAPVADAIIVLGGVVAQPVPPRVTSDLSDAVDRVVHAARLYRAGKAPRVVVAAGNLPWEPDVRPEAELIAELLVEWGVPRDALLLDTASRNTAENAANTRTLMAQHGLRTGLLVTSAGHMPRALALFRAAGVAAIPCSTDLRVADGQRSTVFDWLPDVRALELSTLAVKEWLGLWVSGWTVKG